MTQLLNRSALFCLPPRNVATLLLCLGMVLPALGQQPLQTLLVGIDHRTVTSLNGDWQYLVDQAPGRALYTGNGEIDDRSYALSEHTNIVGNHNQENDFATAPTIKVPGDWNTQVPQLFNYEGVLWYQRDFDAQPKPGTRTFLHIGAANYRSHVWVNQKRVCDHEGGFMPFDCEVTSVLHAGSNFLVIAVDVATLFGYLKDLNANFARLAHYPHDERIERAADRNGIMIWSEIPNWQHISFEKPEVYAKDVTMLREMIRRDRNEASVILWSVSNETPNNPARTKFLTDLANEARKLDPTRLITSAVLGPKPDGNKRVVNDPLCDALDVIGQNEYIGWYQLTPEDADKIQWIFPQKPVLMSEFGAKAKFGNHGAINQRWTEEQQVDVFKHQLVMFSKIPQLRGIIPWVLMDFRSTTRNIPKLQDGFNRKGLASEAGQKKQAFMYLQQVYEEVARRCKTRPQCAA